MAFPTEIWSYIIDNNLGRNDLRNLCVTNRFLSAIAYPILYRNIALTGRSKVELALYTFSASPKLLLHVRWLSLMLGLTEIEWILDCKYSHLTATVNNMKKLQRISLHALFMHGGSIEREMNWTKDWDISRIKRLDVAVAGIPSGLPRLFAKVPDRLPCLSVGGYQNMGYVDGVTELRCEYLEGEVHKPLQMLEKLSITSGIYPPSRIEFAPKLKVLALLGYTDVRGIDRILECKIPRTIKSLGLIFCSQFSMDFVDKLSQFSRLEVAVIESPLDAYNEFSDSEVESLAQALPQVQTIGVLCSRILYSEGSALYSIKLWRKQARRVSGDSYDPSQWSSSTENVRRGAIEALLGFE